ncbi:potassium channel family protein [Celeribacter neptunius]|uniref:Voltage-gated potassium channel n=1 Tax=Celeribacter neptunius TaxID=588602 RepID=A0A1I3K0R9_9RHOB|nr:potassium channel family protein [Celeribacter neptunius]SFI65938.1 voltage-gated potassium channel [Celeribacter neptunius]
MASTFHARLSELYEGSSDRAHRFRYALLAFDLTTILFVIVTSFFTHPLWVEITDLIVGLLILMDFSARVYVSQRKLHYLTRPSTLADIVAMLSFIAPLAGEGLGFLRILRTLRLLHTYQLMNRLRQDFILFRKHEEVIIAAINLLVFIFVTTGLIYALEHGRNPMIRNYADALYFTITTLTTTGFGDITLQGTSGRLLSIGVMFFGVTLFLRLAQVLFRPSKVRYECESCGLMLHDADAVHCKHCGAVVHIGTEGLN